MRPDIVSELKSAVISMIRTAKTEIMKELSAEKQAVSVQSYYDNYSDEDLEDDDFYY